MKAECLMGSSMVYPLERDDQLQQEGKGIPPKPESASWWRPFRYIHDQIFVLLRISHSQQQREWDQAFIWAMEAFSETSRRFTRETTKGKRREKVPALGNSCTPCTSCGSRCRPMTNTETNSCPPRALREIYSRIVWVSWKMARAPGSSGH